MTSIKSEEWNTMTLKNEEHTLRWQLRIENFLWYPAEPGLAIESPEFVCKTSDGSCDLRWSMTILPNGREDNEGKNEKWKNCVGVFLHLKSSPENILRIGGNFRVCVIGKEGVSVKTARAATSCGVNYWNQGYGFGALVTRKELEENQDRLLPGGCLIVECFGKVFFHSKNPTFKPQVINVPIPRRRAEESVLSTMYLKQLNTDVTLKSSEGVFRSHKCVLSARSPYFKALFDFGMVDKEDDVVDLSKFLDGKEMRALLDYIYLDVHPEGMAVENYKALSRLSDVHGFEDLRKFCEEALIAKMPEDVQAIQATSYNESDNPPDKSLEAIQSAKELSLVPVPPQQPVPPEPPKKRKVTHDEVQESTSMSFPYANERRVTPLPYPEQKPRLANW